MSDKPESAAGISSPRLHGSALSPDQIIEWCKAWWESDEWRKTQQRVYACDVAHLLRGVADMIEMPNAEGHGRAVARTVDPLVGSLDGEA